MPQPRGEGAGNVGSSVNPLSKFAGRLYLLPMFFFFFIFLMVDFLTPVSQNLMNRPLPKF